MSVDWVNSARRRAQRVACGAATLALCAASLAAAPADAPPGGYRAGLHYQALDKPLARTDAAAGHVEVVAFFSYSCSHCYRFEPLLQSWVRRLPDDVDYQGSPVSFGHLVRAMHARAFYVIDALDMMQPLHDRVFNAMHVERDPMGNAESIARFFLRNGVDEPRFRSAWKSFGVSAQLSQSDARARSYGVSATPQLGVNGKYLVSSSTENRLSPPQMLKVVDYLIDKERRAMAKSASKAKKSPEAKRSEDSESAPSAPGRSPKP